MQFSPLHPNLEFPHILSPYNLYHVVPTSVRLNVNYKWKHSYKIFVLKMQKN